MIGLPVENPEPRMRFQWWRTGGSVVAWTAFILLSDLLLSAAATQIRMIRTERAVVRAELAQEPYRDSDWGRPYWGELSNYVEQWSPYIVYRVGDMHGRFINVERGVRRTANATARGPRPLVFVFGGSAAWGHGARDVNTIPSWLVRVAAEHGQDVEVRNYAESGWVNWQGIIYLLEKLSDGERPDLVVFYSGVNEVLSTQRWPQVRRPIWDAELYANALQTAVLERTRPLTRARDYYRETSLPVGKLFPRPPCLAVEAPSRETIVAAVTNAFVADKETVERLGHEYGFTTAFVWQLTVAAKTFPSSQDRQYQGWRTLNSRTLPPFDGWSLTADLRETYAAIGRNLVARGTVIELPNAFDGMSASAFIDWMHTSEAGNERVARALYEKLGHFSDLQKPLRPES